MKKDFKLCKTTRFFHLYEISQGVYTALENEEKQAGSNAGFVDLGDMTIIFDTFLNIDAAADLKNAAIVLTGKQARYVVNSHFHMDHIGGNCMFDKETTVLTSFKVREKILTDSTKAYEQLKGMDKKVLAELQEGIKNAQDDDAKAQLENDYKFLSNLMRDGAVLRKPDMTFENKITFYGSQLEAQLIAFDAAHSPGDTLMLLPERKICFMGDLLFNKMHPWLGAGNPEAFVRVLEEILEYDIDIFIPGHGDIASKNEIMLQIKYIKELLALAEKVSETGESERKFTMKDVSEEFRSWDGLCFSWNMDFLMDRNKEQ